MKVDDANLHHYYNKKENTNAIREENVERQTIETNANYVLMKESRASAAEGRSVSR